MPLIPIAGKSIWKNPPIITICLILINCFVFFFIQSGDTNREIEAESFYFESHLAEIELPEYIQYLNGMEKEQPKIPELSKLREDKIVELHWRMMFDKEFLDRLKNDAVVTPKDPHYGEWKNLRNDYERRLSKVVSNTYAFTPGAPSVFTMFTSMFLHGSSGHLIGNMIFLWLSGCLLETGLRRSFFCFTYLFTGLCSTLLHWSFHINSMVPCLGASGAISGLMGALAVLYGWRKIRVFVNLGFYFNYIKIPAILLLPVWIGSELYPLFFSGDSHIAYFAHIGGLISGAAISFVNLKWIRAVTLESLEDETEDRIPNLVEKALTHVEKLEMEKGAKLLEDALAMEPENKTVMVHLYNVRKMAPEKPEFHIISQKLISYLVQNTNEVDNIIKIFTEYKKRAGGVKLPPDIYLKISTMFIEAGKMKNAEGILARLLKNQPRLPGLSTAVHKLAKGYKTAGFSQKYEQCLKILCNKFPETTEAAMAKKVLSSG